MNPKYRFFLQINDGEKIPVYPIYNDDLAIEYELETNQQFYRTNLSGELKFISNDFVTIMGALFDDVYYFYIEKTNDWGKTWMQYYKATFMRTDCTINQDDMICTVKPRPIDQYNDVLAGLEKEYNIIELAPEIEQIRTQKRPLIQIYVPGDNKVSCFFNNLTWEQDAEQISDVDKLRNEYYFATIKSFPVKNLYLKVGEVDDKLMGEYVQIGDRFINANGYYIIDGTNEQLFSPDDELLFVQRDAQPILYDSNDVRNRIGYANQTIDIMGRYILDNEMMLGVDTNVLPLNDIVINNRNYKRAIGYAVENTIAISINYSNTPTEYGVAPNGQYYMPPSNDNIYYPICQSKWLFYSLWFNFSQYDYVADESGRKEYILKNCYPVSSVISTLLEQIAPGITHESTPEYSQFLYSSQNPISGNSFRLFVTPKTNVLAGDYQTPAQNALTTLQQFLNMLRNTFQLYWHINNNKLRIEHISWYRNGGQYGGSAVIGYDLTQLMNVRNGKTWGYASSEYKFDKEDMPERYQFAWMDNVTKPFNGEPIQVLSKYVQKGKIEEINIGNFTTDIDFMYLNPNAINPDGFALFAATKKQILNAMYELPILLTYLGNIGYRIQNGLMAFIDLQPKYWLYDMPARNLLVNGNEMWAYGIKRCKTQDITFPVGDNDPNTMRLIKTYIGNGVISKISVNLSSRTAKATLKYDTE